MNPKAARQLSGAELIREERARQIIGEGWTAAHDDEHNPGDIAHAALCYGLYAWSQIAPHCGWSKTMCNQIVLSDEHIIGWPWDESWWKPTQDPIRNLVKAGALIAAEIDRLQRAK